MDYKDTLNLPKTSFAMKAKLSQQEPVWLKKWEDENLYEKIKKDGNGKKKFTLHDGPPYANGHIHLGTSLNKILKDIICKAKKMEGFDAYYVPGWDCHGLPIEHNVDKKLGSKKRKMTQLEIRQKCREYARRFIDIQKEEFKRLGVLGQWDKPYLTMKYEYEATIAKECCNFAINGGLFRGKKPIHWCPNCKTALAEAEIEHKDETSPSIFVKFLLNENLKIANGKKTYLVIWTTTPWTIPANLAVCLHPNLIYSAVETNGEVLIFAKELVKQTMETFGIENYSILGDIDSQSLENKKCKHPIYDRDSLIILGRHITLEAGTGCVHTAPGHGAEDYDVALKYGLEIYSPLNDNGTFEKEVEFFGGKFAFKANAEINEILEKKGALIKKEQIAHSYPHCWRCKKPVMFRATPQWFISMKNNQLRKKALKKIDEVTWIPTWGRDRIYSMIENRADWCVSRQRVWGVPITVFLCKKCNKLHMNDEIAENIYNLFVEKGADVWFENEADVFLPKDSKCKHCNCNEFIKETDILDVWFDSGVSHSAVLQKNKELNYPADLYLEGSDQHRGWFHSSLLTSVGNYDKAPYKAVLTHGFVVDGKGKKMSKSVGNVIAPKEITNKYGAEILRLWTASSDYRDDIKISENILKQLSDTYRRIRNTTRYMLGNLYDFNTKTDIINYEDLLDIDKFILCKLNELTEKCLNSYKKYDFHIIYHSLNNFCTLDLSSFYLDIIKDRLYTNLPTSKKRKSAQTVMFYLLKYLSKIMSPIFVFTAEEIWQKIPDFENKKSSVHLESFSIAKDIWKNDEIQNKWASIIQIRKEVTKALEIARETKVIGHSLDASVAISTNNEYAEILKEYEHSLKEIFIVSTTNIEEDLQDENVFRGKNNLKISVKKAKGKKCDRCWVYDQSVGENKDVCDKCYKVLKSL